MLSNFGQQKIILESHQDIVAQSYRSLNMQYSVRRHKPYSHPHHVATLTQILLPQGPDPSACAAALSQVSGAVHPVAIEVPAAATGYFVFVLFSNAA
jgi:hypothetical protein